MEKIKKTPKQILKMILKLILIVILIIAIICAALACVTLVGNKSNHNFISGIDTVEYENQLEPQQGEDGYYTFVTDNDFKVMQLTDIHIGAGFLSTKKDNMALNAVAAMISEEKPDLVIVTGDIAFPIPFQAGTLNNKSSAKLFAELMEQLGVYWCHTFGNHDTESSSYYSREQIAAFYAGENYPHCLSQPGPEDIDGVCNYVINIKNTKGEITQSLIMLDSNSYISGDTTGLITSYDGIHENQVEWYEDTINSLTAENNGIMPKSLAFFHIPNPEYKDAWDEYTQNGFEDTENVHYYYGKVAESNSMLCISAYNHGFFDKALELGSTQGIFCGHDHLNNFSLDYKGIELNYSYSIDYLAYSGIMKFGLQRGCTIINIKSDGSFENYLENYYQDKYIPVNSKEAVDLEHEMYE